MALLHCHFFSEALQLSTAIDVILPDPQRASSGALLAAPRRYPVLYLLHGLSDDHTIWQRRTSIERYVSGLDLAVVMPAVDRSFYADMAQGNRYWTYVSEELPALVGAWFPISGAREDTFVAGLSMGGYGAFKLAFAHPERFAAAASFSGALDMVWAVRNRDRAWRAEARRVFGPLWRMPGSRHDLFRLARDVAVSPWREQLRLYQWCGVEDFLYVANTRFRDHAQSLGLQLTYAEGPGGHTWDKWDEQIQRALNWLPLKKKTEG